MSILLVNDPRVAATPIADDGSPLVDLRALGFLTGKLAADASGAFAHVRSDVAERLRTVEAGLPDGLRLLVVEGYRPPSLQQAYFTEYRSELAAARPDATPADLDALASRYISPVAVGPHCTGGAVDLTLCTPSGIELDLGTRVNATPEDSDEACFTASPLVTGEARRLRDLLSCGMTAAGFVNYPTEWWHYSYGERYWATVTGASSAHFGPVSYQPAP